MASDNRLFDDLARMAGGAASLISTVRRQVGSDIKERAQSYTARMDLATRDEIERLQATISKFRSEQEQLKARVAELEASVGGKSKPKLVTASKKKPVKPSRRK